MRQTSKAPVSALEVEFISALTGGIEFGADLHSAEHKKWIFLNLRQRLLAVDEEVSVKFDPSGALSQRETGYRCCVICINSG